MIKVLIKLSKEEKLVQIYDTNSSGTKTYIRVARPLNISAHSPIMPPNGFIDTTCVCDRDMEVYVNMNKRVTDNDGNIYALYLEE